MANQSTTPPLIPFPTPHVSWTAERLLEQLKTFGIGWWGLKKPEVRYLREVLHRDEKLGGVILGNCDGATVMLAATDRRVLYIDKKPLFTKAEDVSYAAIAGVTFEWAVMSGTIILHTKVGDFRVHTMNRKSAEIFRDYIDKRCIEATSAEIKED